jgi:hypothetical protein
MMIMNKIWNERSISKALASTALAEAGGLPGAPLLG